MFNGKPLATIALTMAVLVLVHERAGKSNEEKASHQQTTTTTRPGGVKLMQQGLPHGTRSGLCCRLTLHLPFRPLWNSRPHLRLARFLARSHTDALVLAHVVMLIFKPKRKAPTLRDIMKRWGKAMERGIECSYFQLETTANEMCSFASSCSLLSACFCSCKYRRQEKKHLKHVENAEMSTDRNGTQCSSSSSIMFCTFCFSSFDRSRTSVLGNFQRVKE